MTIVRVLGVDPGSRKAGWGVIDLDMQRRTTTHVDHGVIFLDKDAPLPARIYTLSRQLHRVVETHRPERAAVEDVFVQRGARSALILGQARGAMLATLSLAGLECFSHTTSQVKARVTGRGRANKVQVAEMVTLLLQLAEAPFEDAADALAVALCHALEMTSPVPLPAQQTKTKQRAGRGGLEALARAQGKIA